MDKRRDKGPSNRNLFVTSIFQIRSIIYISLGLQLHRVSN